ncbi:hypothetical protein [Bacteroides sp. 224]|uniref:hypothetical protein n=1 Tax=Bacteroides sp. 224 TaxID=2302936 RepID=UPI0013D4EF55|nr:hypothetical protein [Bacteroides sp. 224]NDV65731.1 hypothetical protein [Bacteroides sp. 224]
MNILIIIGLVIYAIYKISTSFIKTSAGGHDYEDRSSQSDSFETPPPFLAIDAPASSKKTTKKKPDSAITLKAEKYNSSSIQQEQTTESEFNIHSTEEVRRAVIWSEILNRKY